MRCQRQQAFSHKGFPRGVLFLSATNMWLRFSFFLSPSLSSRMNVRAYRINMVRFSGSIGGALKDVSVPADSELETESELR